MFTTGLVRRASSDVETLNINRSIVFGLPLSSARHPVLMKANLDPQKPIPWVNMRIML